MNLSKKLGILVVGICVGLASVAAWSEDIESITGMTRETMAEEAARTVEAYYAAIGDGDVPTIEAMLGGGFKESVIGTLRSEGYDQELRRHYTASELTVTDVSIGSQGGAEVSGSLHMATGESTDISLVLSLVEAPEGYVYRIVGERTTSRL
ncbi:MAG: hypothetical protein H6993_13965 [Pseudomonadales bacterium]|nr:hypothetical protein [Pseudomonadales bacterium]MCP5185067.1 hypothetical protein [Pseudomonadales bacterium]